MSLIVNLMLPINLVDIIIIIYHTLAKQIIRD